jgi:glycosyltransferase involved in cell wall biosynthesis
MNTKVSIIIPIYNVEQYIAQCAHSLFKQTYQNMEFVFVDDASPDSSIFILEKIIAEYNNRREQIILIKKEKNEGLPQARKTGLEKSSGDYIIGADSDDWLELDMIEKMVNKAVSDDLDVVWCDYFEDNKYIKACPETMDKIEILKELLGFNLSAYLWNKLVKREIYLNDIYFPRAMQNEDAVIFIQILFNAEKTGFLNKAFYHYRTNVNSITQSKANLARKSMDYYENYSWIVKFLENKFGNNFNFLEPHLSYRINHVKMKIMETKETRDIKKLYELYPKSLNRLFIKYKNLTAYIQAFMLFLAMKNILFPYKIVDFMKTFAKFKRRLP